MSKDKIQAYRNWLSKSIKTQKNRKKRGAYEDSLEKFNTVFTDDLDVDYAQVQKDIGGKIKDRRKSLGFSAKKIDTELASVFGLGEQFTGYWRSNVEGGYMYGSTGPSAKETNWEINLNKLAVYLETLEIDTNDVLIEQIRIVDDRFVYPLPDSPELSFRVK